MISLAGRLSVDSVLVCTQGALGKVPPVPDHGFFRIREMDMSDPHDVAHWLSIINDAFSRSWTTASFKRNVLEHPHVKVYQTLFLTVENRPIGVASIGVFRRNESIGVGHYLAVRESWQGRGGGRHLTLVRWNMLKKRGIRLGESETTLKRRRSILLYFTLGFRPKEGLDYWNSTDNSLGIIRFIAWRRLHNMYREWCSHQGR